MKKLLNISGLTIVEIIITLAVLGIVIGPLMAMFITSQKINNEGSKEYKSIQLAQQYMEEIKSMDVLDTTGYTKTIDGTNDVYKKTINTESNYSVDIEIKSKKEEHDEIEDVKFDLIMNIHDSSVTLNNNTYSLKESIVNIVLENSKIYIEEHELFENPRLMKLLLEEDAVVNITNNAGSPVKLYIYNINDSVEYDCNVNVLCGEVQKINNNSITPIIKTANNILYDIIIEVKKDGKTINSIDGTTIFKYKPSE